MIADDDPVALATATEALASVGFKVVQATDGQRAIQEALGRRVDLIVMDVSMPQVGGVEACHCLKAMPKTSKIPVVLTAAKRAPADSQERDVGPGGQDAGGAHTRLGPRPAQTFRPRRSCLGGEATREAQVADIVLRGTRSHPDAQTTHGMPPPDPACPGSVLEAGDLW